MRSRLVDRAIRTYPSWWRQTYGDEVRVVADDLLNAGRSPTDIAASFFWGAIASRFWGTGIPNLAETHRLRASAATGVGVVPAVALLPFVLLVGGALNRFAFFTPHWRGHCAVAVKQSGSPPSIMSRCASLPVVPAARLASSATAVTSLCVVAIAVVSILAVVCASRPSAGPKFSYRVVCAFGLALATVVVSAALSFDWSPGDPTSSRTWAFWSVIGVGWLGVAALSAQAVRSARPLGLWLRLGANLAIVAALVMIVLLSASIYLSVELPIALQGNPDLVSPLGAWWPYWMGTLALATIAAAAGAWNAVRFERSARLLAASPDPSIVL